MKRPFPLTQGDVSGDCMLYATLNAVRYLFPDQFTELEPCEQLLGRLVTVLGDNTDEMLRDGTDATDIIPILQGAAIAVPALRWVAPFQIGKMSKELFGTVHDNLTADSYRRRPDLFFDYLQMKTLTGHVVIVGLDEPENHWTVIRKITVEWVYFYDSWAPGRLHRRHRDSFVIDREEKGRISIDLAATVLLAGA